MSNTLEQNGKRDGVWNCLYEESASKEDGNWISSSKALHNRWHDGVMLFLLTIDDSLE